MCRIEKKDRSNPLFTLAGAGEKYHKRSRSRQASFISHPLSLSVAEGICLSQISLAWKKKSPLHVFPRQWERTQWKPLQNVTGISFSAMWALTVVTMGACNSHPGLAPQVREKLRFLMILEISNINHPKGKHLNFSRSLSHSCLSTRQSDIT